MFDVAPTELLLVVVVALVVIGPKDLPKAMRFVGKWMAKARGMARHFRSGLDTMMREAELEELEKQWREPFGDRMNEMVFIGRALDRPAIEAAWRRLHLSPDECRRGPAYWASLPDPFPAWEPAEALG